jgi:hypothetical protein
MEAKKMEELKESFDTLGGIKNSISDLEKLSQMLEMRRRFVLENPSKKLNCFFVFGQFLLDEDGDIRTIDKGISNERVLIKTISDVETLSNLTKEKGKFWFGHSEFTIPIKNIICGHCQKELTIADVNNCLKIDNDFYHYNCHKEYLIQKKVDELIDKIFKKIYVVDRSQVSILPNGYCKKACCEDKPWIVVKTIDGDIKVGWNKQKNISIQWQENYKEFDIEILQKFSIFDDSRERAVFAYNYDFARVCVKLVKEI